ncbi:hypothetical protein DL96DRAFT_1752785 [Flagelloscypha sp. PMI_526]|nr:hypothetical protein DL96DRAFT_1752785 [Flagelloscypha sp. PMI_526]
MATMIQMFSAVEDRIHRALEIRNASLQVRTRRNAPKFLRLCGLDPKMATHQDVIHLNPLFLCVRCNTQPFHAKYNEKMVLNFPAVLEHGMDYHNDLKDDNEYLVVTDDDKKRLSLGAEAEVIQRCCISECQAKVKYQEVSSHMSQCHGQLKFMPGTFFAANDEIHAVDWFPLHIFKRMETLSTDSIRPDV